MDQEIEELEERTDPLLGLVVGMVVALVAYGLFGIVILWLR